MFYRKIEMPREEWLFYNPISSNPHYKANQFGAIKLRRAWLYSLIIPIAPALFMAAIIVFIHNPWLMYALGFVFIFYLVLWYLVSSTKWRRYESFWNYVIKDANLFYAMETAVIKKSHDAAIDVIVQFEMTGQPFALFMRSFDSEVVSILTPVGTGDYGAPRNIRSATNGPSEIEAKLAPALKPWLQLIGVANPFNSNFNKDLHFLQLPPDDWQSGVERLAKIAAMIVIDVRSAAGVGTLWELDLILRLDRQNDTIVIVGNRKDDNVDVMLLLYKNEFGNDVPQYLTPKAKINNVLLEQFLKKCRIDDINFEHLTETAVFAEILERVKSGY
jgi:hypothetical protein